MRSISAGVLQAAPSLRPGVASGPCLQFEKRSADSDVLVPSCLVLPPTSHVIAPARLKNNSALILPRGVEGAVAAGMARSPGVLVLLRHGQSLSNLEKRFTG